MPLYHNGKQYTKAFKGDHRPINIYKGNTKIAGWKYEIKSGQQLVFEGTYNDYVTDLIIEGNSVQNGTPAPNNPVLIESVLGDLISHTPDNSKQFTYPLIELNRIGDVADSYNPLTGELVKRIGKYTFTGSENHIQTYQPADAIVNLGVQYGFGVKVLCTHFPPVNPIDGPYYDDISGFCQWNLETEYMHLYFKIPKSFLPEFTVEAVKSWLAEQYGNGTPVTAYYQLAEPIITYFDQIQIPTYYPTVIIETESPVTPTLTATVKVID